ncbi:hypothetical protein B0H17DRAFT_1138395 [Mycena rosella]|uniref:Uncharacterized protein n=1 Tax=Mycena rosella TaxID=1033263 RepID=A0AAD7D6L0_MYCRO|nr:hypothetical protein B0H17DRAFT_1138395 [Mycena rosella]
MWDIANGKYKAVVPIVGSPFYVDARDVALAHVRAVECDAAKGQRYLLIGRIYVPGHFVEVMDRHFPELRDNLPPADLCKAGQTSSKHDSTKATREFGIECTSLETMVVDTIRYIPYASCIILKKMISPFRNSLRFQPSERKQEVQTKELNDRLGRGREAG